jgi:YHS domain-containing protein/thioredoxin-related protein
MQMARRILPVLLFFVIQQTGFGQQPIHWEGTIDSAKAAAARSNRLVLVLFTADWCPSCHRLENDLRGQPGAPAALEANFVPVKLNYDYFQNIARQYGVDRLPTTVILAPNAAGDVLAVIPEAMPVDQYLSKLNGVATDVRRRAAGAYAQIQASPAVGSAMSMNPLRQADQAPAGRPLDPAADVGPPGKSRMPVAAASAEIPAVSAASAAAAPSGPRPKPLPAATEPTIGLDGYCPVQLVEKDRWQKGNKDWGVIHRGKVYLFVGQEEQRRFLADPDRFAPVSSGNDIVLAAEVGRTVAGFREYGAKYDGHVYLFASEVTLKKFESNPPYYAQRALQALHPVSQTADTR